MVRSFSSIYPFVESEDLRRIIAIMKHDDPPEETPDTGTFSSAGVDNAGQIQDMVSTRRIFDGTFGISEQRVEPLREAYS